jgi:hypothetical protein
MSIVLKELDAKIALSYAPMLTNSLKYGENGVFCWFPGSGMTTILRDVFTDKKILSTALGKLATSLKISFFWGHLASKRNSESLFQSAGYADFEALKGECLKTLELGQEVVLIVGRIDDYAEKEKVEILKLFVNLSALNPRRVHVLFNTVNKPWFVKIIQVHSEFIVLANRIEMIPVLKESLLQKYIETRAEEYGYVLTQENLNNVVATYGGILQATKEYLRSYGDFETLELKLRVIFNNLPKEYCEILKNNVYKVSSNVNPESLLDLKKLGVLDLRAFSDHKNILDINPDRVASVIMTTEELSLLTYCKKHRGESLSRSTVTKLLRPEGDAETSLWAIDQAVSRFRKKLKKCGIDPSSFKTLKGKGFVWLT